MDTQIIDLGNTHMLKVCNKIKNVLTDDELGKLKTFLSIKFPKAFNVLKLDEVESIEISTPYDEFKTILINHLDLLDRDDMMDLNQIAEFYWEDENAFQILHSIMSKIKRNTASPEEIDYELRREVWEELDTIRKIKNNQSKAIGIKSLEILSDIYEQHPQHREYIVAELKRLEGQIKFLAPEYCGNQGEDSAVSLSPFRMIVRGIKLN